jgi:DNA helicase-4
MGLNNEKQFNNEKKNLMPFSNESQSENAIRTLECGEFIESILESDEYIARSDYLNRISEYSADIDFISVLKKSGMLDDYCKRNGLSSVRLAYITEVYQNIQKLVDRHNDDFVSNSLINEKDYLDNVLKAVDPNIVLDDDQRRVVLTDEDYCLVIAGAGAGKTTTVAAKVKYLVDKKGIDPKQILVVSFTNKAVNELKERIQRDLDIPCPIATFHSTGNAIIHKNTPEEKINIVDQSKLYFVIRDYFRNSIMRNESAVNNLIMFFASYFDAPYEGSDLNGFFNNIAKANFSTMRSDLEDFKREVIDTRTKKSVTIQNEVLRSYQEVEIANFLYLNNIDYEYEPIYKYDIEYSRKPYTPDFIIYQGERIAYLEHFGITESGENDRFSPEEVELYKKAVNDKVKLHKEHGTTLLYTFSAYNDGKTLLEHLKEKLEINGFELKPRSNKEVMEMLVAGEENRYIRKLISLICRFISNFKVNAYQAEDFNRMYHSTQNVRSRLFLSICNDCYLEYERWLKENKAVDFEDMINESARLLREVKEMKKKLDFKYIIVDEYQDISRQRFDLTKELSEVTDAKIIAVGDDWQSIYAFSGSDITLFTKFEEKMGYAKMLKIVRTYRNSQEVIDIAGNFIQQNKEQINKQLISNKHITDPVLIYTYDSTRKKQNDNRKSGSNYEMARAIEQVLQDLIYYKREEGKEPGSILLLGRYGFDGDQLERTGLFEYINRTNKVKSVKYPKLDITFMTAHSSKGLGYDDVIVINGKNETYGFPSKVEDDPVLSFVIKGDHAIDYAEERRLFYVAMTRTKNRVFFIAPEANPSEFLLEIKQHYKNVKLLGEWNEEEPVSIAKKPCPICGYPMQLKYKKSYGLRLYICSNEPEICGFMTNDYRAGKLAIQKCEKCRDGYLVVKPGRDQNYFLGCTNYKPNGTGCNNTISKQAYYAMMGYKMEEPDLDTADNTSNMFWGFSKGTVQKEEKVKTNINTNSDPSIGLERKLKLDNSLKSNPYRKNQPQDINEKENDSNNDDFVEVIRAEIKPVLYKNMDLNVVIFNIVKVLQDISLIRFYGITILCDVLRGSNNVREIENKLDEINGFGIYKKLPNEMIKTIVEWMISEHYILQTKQLYPVLHSTYEGLHYSETISERKLKHLRKVLIDKFGDEDNAKEQKKVIGEGFYLTEESAQRFEYKDYYYIEEIRKELNRVMYRQKVKRLHTRELIAFLKDEDYIRENSLNEKLFYSATEKGKAKGIVERKRKDDAGFSFAILLYSQEIQRIIVEYFKKMERVEIPSEKETKQKTSQSANKKMPDNAGAKWTSEEDELLDKQFQSGMSISDISKAHNRTNKAIRIRLQRHGLIDWNYKD